MKRLKQFIVRKIAGETVLVPFGETSQEFNGLITLNDVAAFIWENIENVETEEEMAKLLLEEFEVDEELAMRDAGQFIGGLKASGFIE